VSAALGFSTVCCCGPRKQVPSIVIVGVYKCSARYVVTAQATPADQLAREAGVQVNEGSRQPNVRLRPPSAHVSGLEWVK
jgi:hypothetical protein